MMRIRLLFLVLVFFVAFSFFTAVSQAAIETSAWDRTLAENRVLAASSFNFSVPSRGWRSPCSFDSQLRPLAGGCPAGFPLDCGNGRCCPSGTVCCREGGCCPTDAPLCCGNGKCCGAGKPHACPSQKKCYVTLNDAINDGCTMQEVFVCGQPIR